MLENETFSGGGKRHIRRGGTAYGKKKKYFTS
jgi:hypothetical protein